MPAGAGTRAFVALDLPGPVLAALVVAQRALPAGRTVPEENLHLTLAFLGALPPPLLDEVHLALEALSAPAFELRIRGMGVFGEHAPRAV